MTISQCQWLHSSVGIARSQVQIPLKSWIFQASLRNCKNCVHNCEDHSFTWFHIRSSYMIQFIFHFIVDSFHRWFIPHRIIRTHKWPAPNVSGFIAQLVRASHRYREVTGSNPVEVLNFQASLRNCKNCVQNCEDHSFTWFLGMLCSFHLLSPLRETSWWMIYYSFHSC